MRNTMKRPWRRYCLASLGLRAAPVAALLCHAPSATAEPLREPPMVAPAAPIARVEVVSDRWIQLILPEVEYDPLQAGVAANFSVASADDPAFKAGVTPVVVHRRHWPESAPWADDAGFGDAARIEVVYRVFLQLPVALTEGSSYSLSVAAGVGVGGPFPFVRSPSAANAAIHVNQVAYLADGPKIAYLSAWTGEGTVDFSAAQSFEVVDEATGDVVHVGEVHLDVTADQEPWSRSDVHSLDFSAFTAPGRYHLRVLTVGPSYSFEISPTAFTAIGYTLLRGMMHQRDGEHGLGSPDVTHWTRPPAHLDDAIVESTGKRVDLVGGHMDAGDRGKYPHNTADVAASLLTAIKLFPDQVEALGESLQLAESDNGIPDLVDEAIYELEFLRKVVMNTPKDGTVPFYLRPQNQDQSGGYEMGAPLAGKPDRKLYDATMGPNRAETLYAAGALAMAYNTPLLRQYAPAECEAYLVAAKRAFAGFQAHDAEPGYFKEAGWYDAWTEGPSPYADELLIAATNLLEATGDDIYIAPLKAALPADLTKVRHWGWMLTGPWLPAFVSMYTGTEPKLEQAVPGVQALALAAIVDWGDATLAHDGKPFAAPFGAPLPPFIAASVGWYFSGDNIAYPAMVAYGVTHDAKYRDVIVKTWSYLLGTNPLSRSFISGMGDPQRRPRWMVHEIGSYQWKRYKAADPGGWSEIVPGIPSADVQSGDFDGYLDEPWNTARKTKKFPAQADYPPLYRYHDSWTVKNEFTIDRLARGAVSVIPLVAMAEPGPDPDTSSSTGEPTTSSGDTDDTGPAADSTSTSAGGLEGGGGPGMSSGPGGAPTEGAPGSAAGSSGDSQDGLASGDSDGCGCRGAAGDARNLAGSALLLLLRRRGRAAAGL